jgi:hypothetical protein
MKRKFTALFFAGLLCATLGGGFDAGNTVFTKRYETDLLTDPQPLAGTVATLPFAAGVKIISLQGKWANVTATNGTGWIYLGNLADEKPAEDHSINGLQTSASATTASVAARPLDNVTAQYVQQEGLGQAAADVRWLERQSDVIGKAAVTRYLKAGGKGEYQ